MIRAICLDGLESHYSLAGASACIISRYDKFRCMVRESVEFLTIYCRKNRERGTVSRSASIFIL